LPFVRKSTKPTDLDLADDPGIGRPPGIASPPDDEELQGENTVEVTLPTTPHRRAVSIPVSVAAPTNKARRQRRSLCCGAKCFDGSWEDLIGLLRFGQHNDPVQQPLGKNKQRDYGNSEHHQISRPAFLASFRRTTAWETIGSFLS
jgi:hypothetical protein